MRDHGFRWGYTWVKTQLHTAGLVERPQRRGAHRRKRERKPCEGMMLHQDGSRAAWLAGRAGARSDRDHGRCDQHDLLGVPGRGRRHRLDVSGACWRCLPRTACRRASIPIAAATISTPRRPDGPVDKQRLDPGRPGARSVWESSIFQPIRRRRAGARERMFGTLQDRLIKELAQAGITEIDAANLDPGRLSAAHNARFAKPAALAESAFVAADPALLAEVLCIEEERVVARDNTVAYDGRRLQLPASPARAHYVKATVKVREYPDGSLAVFHGPRRLARYDAAGKVLKASNLRAAA